MDYLLLHAPRKVVLGLLVREVLQQRTPLGIVFPFPCIHIVEHFPAFVIQRQPLVFGAHVLKRVDRQSFSEKIKQTYEQYVGFGKVQVDIALVKERYVLHPLVVPCSERGVLPVVALHLEAEHPGTVLYMDVEAYSL